MYLPIQLSRNKVLVRIDAFGVGSETNRSGLRYEVDVQVQEWYRSNNYVAASNQPLQGSEAPAQRQGGALIYPGATFEVQDLLDSVLTRTAPRFGQSTITVCEGLSRQYYADTQVLVDGVVKAADRRPTSWVLKAGVPERDWAAWSDRLFVDESGLAGHFLTWSPKHKVILPDQPEYLYWLSNLQTLPSSIRAQGRVRYDDGATEDFSGQLFEGVAPMTVYCLPVGLEALGLTTDRKVISYTVWLANESNQPISEQRSYQIDWQYHAQYRFILFANSLGGFDSLALAGSATEKLMLNRLISERPADPEGNPSYAERVISTSSGERELTINTALLSVEHREWLQELVFSQEVYLVTDRAHLPLLPQNQDYMADDSEETLVGRNFVFRYANKEQNAGSLSIAPARPTRPTVWVPHSFSCELDGRGRRTGRALVTMLKLTYQDTGQTVLPQQVKPNLPGEEGYLAPLPSATCREPVYLSAAISRYGSFKRSNCGSGQTGIEALIEIAAGAFGSEISQADADAHAEAAWRQLDTQATADQFGTCNANPANYVASVPQGQFHVRLTHPYTILITNDGPPVQGNRWDQPPGSLVYTYGTADMNFPVAQAATWQVSLTTPRGGTGWIRVYRNGELKSNNERPYNAGPWPLFDGFTVNAGDRIYIQYEHIRWI